MYCEIDTFGEGAGNSIAALPDEALPCYLQAWSFLELTPWNGDPYNKTNPQGAMRQIVFGPQG